MRYLDLAEVYEGLEKTQKRLSKTSIISRLIGKTPAKELPAILLLLEGRVFPAWNEKKIGVAQRLVMKAISLASGEPIIMIEKSLNKTGDLGLTAAEFLTKKKQHTLGQNVLTVEKVFSNLQRLADLEGAGSTNQKVQLVAELLTSAAPIESRYIARTVLEDLRIGIGEGAIRDAIVWAVFGEKIGLRYDEEKNELVLPDDARAEYNRYQEIVQDAYNIYSDFGQVAKSLKEKDFDETRPLGFAPGKPLKVMLFQKAQNIEEAFDIVGKPAAFEYKYDGFRVQVHRSDGKIRLFTRRLEDVTEQFPDILEAVKRHAKGDSFILDGEAVGIGKGSGYLPFQAISQRIKRKHGIEKMAKLYPVELNVFDILEWNGKSMLDRPFSERRAAISRIIDPVPKKILPSRIILTQDPDEAHKFYNESLDMGNEGVMAKSLSAIYKPGKRVGYGVKIKPVMESLDLVIVGAEWGEGKRARLLTSYILACRDDSTLAEIGRVSTGLKEISEDGVSFKQMTDILLPLKIEESGKTVKVKPSLVIEVHYEEIQQSPTYSSGFALRFPRFIRLREDRSPRDIDTLETVRNLYTRQRGRDRA
jgi:DNA ligase 1